MSEYVYRSIKRFPKNYIFQNYIRKNTEPLRGDNEITRTENVAAAYNYLVAQVLKVNLYRDEVRLKV